MKLKKTVSVLLAGLMLVGGGVSVAADSPVYTANEVVTRSDCTVKPYYYYNNGYFYNWIYDSGKNLEAYWNPVTGYYDTCTCPYCTGVADLNAYYYVNGIRYCAKDYYVNYAPHTVSVTPVATGEYSKETGIVEHKSAIPSGMIIKKKKTTTDSNVIVTDSGVSVKNPSVIGGYNRVQNVCGTYYAYDKVDMSAYFAKHTLGMSLTVGEKQTFGTGFKMISSDSNVVRITSDAEGQHLDAVGMGSAEVYLYTGGGVPFMKFSISVVNSLYTPFKSSEKYLDIKPSSWRIEEVGSSVTLDIFGTEKAAAGGVKVEVVSGNGYLQDNKDGGKNLVSTGNGPIVVRAYNLKNASIQAYAIVYVGKYVDALYDGYWTNNNGNISCSYWNPNLWGCGGYKINGWILTDTGSYLPVVSKVETTTQKPNGDKVTTTTTIYSDVYDLFYDDCYGNVDTLYTLLWKNGKLTGSSSTLYEAAMKEILEDIAEDLAKQYH